MAAATQLSSLMGEGGQVVKTCNSYISIEPIAAAANAAELQSHAIEFSKGIGITFDIQPEESTTAFASLKGGRPRVEKCWRQSENHADLKPVDLPPAQFGPAGR